MTKLEKAIEYVDKLWKQQPNELGIMPDLGNEFMWVVDFMQEQEAELEALKKDVARFLVLLDKAIRQKQTTEEMHERWTLEEKLRKVGKEE